MSSIGAQKYVLLLCNTNYPLFGLPRTDEDVSYLKSVLTECGYFVTVLKDFSPAMLQASVQRFRVLISSNPGSSVAVVYLGYGMVRRNDFYFVSTKHDVLRSGTPQYDAETSLRSIVDKLSEISPSSLSVIVHCSYPTSYQFSDSRNWPQSLSTDIPVSFLASAAINGLGYELIGSRTTIFIEHLCANVSETRNIEIAMKKIVDTVREATSGKQVPELIQNERRSDTAVQDIGLRSKSRALASSGSRESDVLQLTLRGVPKGSIVRVDDTVVSGDVIRLERQELFKATNVLLQVDNPDYPPFRTFLNLSKGPRHVHTVLMTQQTTRNLRFMKVRGRQFAHVTKFPELRRYLEFMELVPGGTFTMGSRIFASEMPPHRVTISPFFMGKYLIHAGLWKEYCDHNNLPYPEVPFWGFNPDLPAVGVSWIDIVGDSTGGGFLKWASDIAGKQLRLPTEAEFEYAAGGPRQYTFPWGNSWNPELLVHKGNNTPREQVAFQANLNVPQPAPVNRIGDRVTVNDFGLVDMAGNAWQWTNDYYGRYRPEDVTDPTGPATSEHKRKVRVLRGGAWTSSPYSSVFRTKYREWHLPEDASDLNVGFRICFTQPVDGAE